MSIGCAIQNGPKVVVYDLHGRQLYAKLGQLRGLTGQAVTIGQKRSHLLVIYDEQGHQLATIPG